MCVCVCESIKIDVVSVAVAVFISIFLFVRRFANHCCCLFLDFELLHLLFNDVNEMTIVNNGSRSSGLSMRLMQMFLYAFFCLSSYLQHVTSMFLLFYMWFVNNLVLFDVAGQRIQWIHHENKSNTHTENVSDEYGNQIKPWLHYTLQGNVSMTSFINRVNT